MSLILPPEGIIARASAFDFVPALPPASVDLCLTSPPYWAKRTYAPAASNACDPRELGQERSPWTYLAKLIILCSDLRRALKPTGWLVINLADTYSNQPGRGRGTTKRALSQRAQSASATAPDARLLDRPLKSLSGIPWRLADALTQQGWRWRNTIVWLKLGHQPEHVTDRLTQAWEPLLCLAPGPRSYYAHPRDTHAGANDIDVWPIHVGRPTLHTSHPAVFPDELAHRVITRFCPPGGLILDPFAGSGTVRDVAHTLGRRFTGCDLYQWPTAPHHRTPAVPSAQELPQ